MNVFIKPIYKNVFLFFQKIMAVFRVSVTENGTRKIEDDPCSYWEL